MIGSAIVTSYNKRTYLVDDIAFDITPLHSFSCGGNKLKFCDYLEQKYAVKILAPDQPMLLSKNSYLVPELCFPTGMTERLREKKAIFREVASH